MGIQVKTVLHVGCGSNPAPKLFTGPQWRELRLDIDPSVEPDIVANIVAMTPVADVCVEAVFSSHNLEHLYAHEVSLALTEFYRVLKPGGLLVVTMPDLQAVAAAVASDRLEETLYVSPGGAICPIDVLFGQRSAIRDGNVFMAHKTGFTAKTLRQKLEGAGFGNVRVEHGDLFDLWGAGYRPGTLNAIEGAG